MAAYKPPYVRNPGYAVLASSAVRLHALTTPFPTAKAQVLRLHIARARSSSRRLAFPRPRPTAAPPARQRMDPRTAPGGATPGRRAPPRFSEPAQSPFDDGQPWRIASLHPSAPVPSGRMRFSEPAATAFSTDKDLLRARASVVEQHQLIVVKKGPDVEKASDYKGQYRVRGVAACMNRSWTGAPD